MLNSISDNKGSRYKFKRRGRGIGAGKGKTCGRGGKGQTARSGVALNGFEGGQTPLYRRLPKRGFTNVRKISYEVMNFDDIQRLVDAKKVEPHSISIASLRAAGALKGRCAMLKILGAGELKSKVSIEAHSISISAKAKLEKNGSQVTVITLEAEAPKEKKETKKVAAKPAAKKAEVKEEKKPAAKKPAAKKAVAKKSKE